MITIYYLMGKSASGKDTIYQRLLAKLNVEGIQVNPLITYTTRPKRENEIDGEEYYFVTDKSMNKLDVIEKRVYETKAGKWTYATSLNNLEDGKKYMGIGTLNSFMNISKNKNIRIIPFYIFVPDNGARLLRAIERERKQQIPNYKELCRRFLADEDDFSREKLDMANIDRAYKNEVLDECVDAIFEDIKYMKDRT